MPISKQQKRVGKRRESGRGLQANTTRSKGKEYSDIPSNWLYQREPTGEIGVCAERKGKKKQSSPALLTLTATEKNQAKKEEPSKNCASFRRRAPRSIRSNLCRKTMRET